MKQVDCAICSSRLGFPTPYQVAYTLQVQPAALAIEILRDKCGPGHLGTLWSSSSSSVPETSRERYVILAENIDERLRAQYTQQTPLLGGIKPGRKRPELLVGSTMGA